MVDSPLWRRRRTPRMRQPSVVAPALEALAAALSRKQSPRQSASPQAARAQRLASSLVYYTAKSSMDTTTRRSSGDRTDGVEPVGRGSGKCRIPQRLLGAGRPATNSVTIPRGRPGYTEPTTRPKSANRIKEELYHSRLKHFQPKSAKPERIPPVIKRPSPLPKKTNAEGYKSIRPIILVPMTQVQQQQQKPLKTTLPYTLPDQETIKREEDTEQQLSQMSPTATLDQKSDRESITSRGDQLIELKIIWQDKMVQFENMKGDLKELQKNILALYAKMRETHQKMSTLGEDTNLPPPEDLRIMNVSNMTPEQLLQLCAGDDNREHHWNGVQSPLTIDMNKLYEMPSKLVNTCEQTLTKRKEIIDWFETLKSQEKGISVHKLSKKINEFNAENDMLKCSLENARSEFLKELEEIVGFMRKNVNDTMAMQLRMEELTLEMSQLNAQNTDLKKQIHNADHLRSHINKNRVEELEKELKEEKCKRLFMRDRLSRSEGQVKINVERAAQLEATLEQARSQIWSLERTVQQLHDQNQKLQDDFDKELGKLTESIREHTVHLEEIAEAREKLQAEKEDLEKRLTELSAYYNESLHNMKKEMATNVAKVIETEKKFEEQEEDRKKLEVKLEVLCTQLLEAEMRHKAALQQIHEKEELINQETEALREFENTKRELEEANSVISDNRNRLTKQNETIKDIERRLKEAEDTAENLKSELLSKDEYISEMERKQQLLEQQLQENENKMEAYVEQLSSLKDHINQLQEDFGEFENLNDLHEMLNNQRAKLLESTRHNGELAEALQKKDKELKQHEHLLLEREDIIKTLSEKEEEQSNIIKILKNNLELRSRADTDLNQQLMEKNTEIDSLLVNLDTRKQQISNMEKIILTLEDQTRKASLQRKKDQDLILSLQKKITEYEALQVETSRNVNSPENLDSLIKILEDELGTTFENEFQCKDHTMNQHTTSKKKYHGDRKREKLDNHENNYYLRYQPEPDSFPIKNVMKNNTKKNSFFNEDQYIGDNLDRKKAITNMDTQRWVTTPEHNGSVNVSGAVKENVRRMVSPPGPPQNPLFTRNLPYLSSDLQSNDRKFKMFKIAGHRL